MTKCASYSLFAASLALALATTSASGSPTPSSPKKPTTKAECRAMDWSKAPEDSKDDWYSNCQNLILAGDPKHGAEQTNVPLNDPASL